MEACTIKSEKRQFGAVDVLRMLMAVCVLFIHRGYVLKNETAHFFIRYGICELAVPFFVITTSFFVYRKTLSCPSENRKDVFFKYIKHLSLLLLLWTVIYIPPFFYKECFASGNGITDALRAYAKDFFINGQTYLHLWYIQALIISSIIIYYLGKKLSTGKLLIIFYVLYFAYQFLENCEIKQISEIYSQIPPALFNYTCRISVFIVFGKLLAENNKYQNYLKTGAFGLIISLILGAVFLFLRFRHQTLGASLQYLILPLTVFFMFSVCISINFSFSKQAELRKTTELFYFVHLIIPIELYDLIFTRIFNSAVYNIWVVMTFYTVFSLAAALLIIKASKLKKLSFLKYLY